jgi:hypothetical protein
LNRTFRPQHRQLLSSSDFLNSMIAAPGNEGTSGNQKSAHADLAPAVQPQHPIGCRARVPDGTLKPPVPGRVTAAVPTLQSPSHDSEFPYF